MTFTGEGNKRRSFGQQQSQFITSKSSSIKSNLSIALALFHTATHGDERNDRRLSSDLDADRATLTSDSGISNCDGRDGVSSASNNLYSGNLVSRSTPILFSTNRGLHLRLLSVDSFTSNPVKEKRNNNHEPKVHLQDLSKCSSQVASMEDDCSNPSAEYNVSFCDLERWSTRANFLCLENTFVLKTLQPELKKSDCWDALASLRATQESTFPPCQSRLSDRL